MEQLIQTLITSLDQVRDDLKINAINDTKHDLEIESLRNDIEDVKRKIEELRNCLVSDETRIKAGMFDVTKNLFAKKIFWIIFIVMMALTGFGLAGVLSNTDNVVKLAKTIKGE